MNFLIVDDCQLDGECIINIISELDHKPYFVDSLKKALSIVKKRSFDFFIVDYFFSNSEKNGESLVSVLRKNFPSIPIIMMSALDDENIIEEAILRGADFFCPKISHHTILKTFVKSIIHQVQINRNIAKKAKIGVSSFKYYSKELCKEIDRISSQKFCNTLIDGMPGSGKSELSSLIAKNWTENFDEINTIKVVDFKNIKKIDIEEKLFGNSFKTSFNIFEKSADCILIFDNIDYLEKPLQRNLLKIYSEFSNKKSLRIIVTKTTNDENLLIDEIFVEWVDKIVTLKTLWQEKESLKNIINTIASKFSIDGIKINFKRDAIERLSANFCSLTIKNNYRGIIDSLEKVARYSLHNGRTIVSKHDLKYISHDFSQDIEKGILEVFFKDPSSSLLMNLIVEGQNIKNIKKLSTQMAVNFAYKKYNKDLKKMSFSLGIKQSSIYTQLGEINEL